MIGDTLTIENLERIETAMKHIKKIDRSDYFIKYYYEVVLRLDQIHSLNKLQENARNREIDNMA